MKAFLLLLAVVFIAGCTDVSVFNSEGQLPSDCEGFCESQPHIQCAGFFQVSGDYPNCNCEYICSALQ